MQIYSSRLQIKIVAFILIGLSIFTFTQGLAIAARSTVPTLISPSNNSQLNTNTPTYSWSSVPKSTKYTFQLTSGQDTSFAAPIVIKDVTSTSYASENLLTSGSYIWRVRSVQQNSVGGWSTVYNFTVPSYIAPTTPNISGNWQLNFADEFDGTLIDLNKWHTCFPWAGTTCSLWSNNELQLYNPEDVIVTGGALKLRAQKRDMVGWNGQTYNYTSGMIQSGGIKNVTQPGFTFTYGYAETKIKIPAGKGLWPAFWMLPADYTALPEIDIMEILGQQPNLTYMTYHYSGGDPGSSYTGPDFSTGWHTFAVDWQPGVISWYIDGVKRWTYTNSVNVSNTPMYLLLNLAVGGNWPGSPDSTTKFPSDYLVDYVRVWQR